MWNKFKEWLKGKYNQFQFWRHSHEIELLVSFFLDDNPPHHWHCTAARRSGKILSAAWHPAPQSQPGNTDMHYARYYPGSTLQATAQKFYPQPAPKQTVLLYTQS